MKIYTRWLLVLLLVAAPAIAVVHTASANTELVPASRLVAPLVTLEPGRNTFFLLTNVSALELTGTASTTVTGVVHVEFYSKACSPSSDNVPLSAGDIDQLNVTSTNANSIFADSSKLGFADIDVRSAALITSTGVQANALLGEVVISDTVADFTLSYPMASSLGSAASGVGTAIVTRNGAGAAANWTGRYEPFPTRIFVPGYYAEGGTGGGAISTASTPPLGTLLAVVSPADGNWYGGTDTAVEVGEAPGQSLTAIPVGSVLIQSGILVWDGCEHQQNFPKSGHTIMDSLGNLFGAFVNRDTANAGAGWGDACSDPKPTVDADSNSGGVPLGWIDIPNNSCARNDNANTSGGIATGACTTGALTLTLAKPRGIVGVLMEVATVVGTGVLKGADVARAWGDFSTITTQTGCKDSANGTLSGCSYSLATGIAPNNVSMP